MATSKGHSHCAGIPDLEQDIVNGISNNNNNNNNNYNNSNSDNSNGFREKPKGLLEAITTASKKSPATSPKMTKRKNNSRASSPEDRAMAPPGPSGLPYVGSMFDWKGPETNLAWTKQHGGIYHVKMGSKHLVYLNTIDLVKEYMEGKKGEQYLDRPMGPAAIAQGLLFGSGESWKKNKRAFMKALHTETFAANMEEVVQSEIQLVIKNLLQLRHAADEQPPAVKLGDYLIHACSCVIPGLLRGCALPPGSQDREELMKVTQNMEGVDLTSILTQISLKYPILTKITSTVDIHETSRRLQNLLRAWIQDAKTGPHSPTSPRSKTTCFQLDTTDGNTASTCPFRQNSKRLKKVSEDESSAEQPQSTGSGERRASCSGNVQECENNERILVAFGFTDTGPGEQEFEEPEPPMEPSSMPPMSPITQDQWTFNRQMSLNVNKESILQRILKQPEFAGVTEGTDTELLQSLIDMFFGGVTSTLSALEFVFVHLVRNPSYQSLARKEVDEMVSKYNGDIQWSMKKEMPYVSACITEALRLGSITPSSLPHIATKDTLIKGYGVPEGTFVLSSIYSIHRDPRHYLDPEEFRPQRHLTVDHQYKEPTSYRPYGIGARKCVGVEMSEMQLFVYTVYILRHFKLEPIKSNSLPNLDTHMRVINRLKDFRCRLRKRDV